MSKKILCWIFGHKKPGDIQVSMYKPHYERLGIEGTVTPCRCGKSDMYLVEKLWGERTFFVECNSCKGQSVSWHSIEWALKSWDGKPIWANQ